MKKIVCLIFCLPLVIFLMGCQKIVSDKNDFLFAEFDGNAEICYKGVRYTCNIIYKPQGIERITFEFPSSLKGVSVLCENGKYEISKGNLCAKYDCMPLDFNSLMFKIDSIFKSMNNSENFKFISKSNDEKYYEGKLENDKYKFVTDGNGKLREISMINSDLTIKMI